jgi:hypothetical protein
MVTKWDRDTIEDKYLRMYEENLILKKHARKQEDKIKRFVFIPSFPRHFFYNICRHCKNDLYSNNW